MLLAYTCGYVAPLLLAASVTVRGATVQRSSAGQAGAARHRACASSAARGTPRAPTGNARGAELAMIRASLQGSVKQLLALRRYSAWVTPASGALLVAGGTYTLLTRLVPA